LAEASASPVWTAEAQFDWAVILAARGETDRAQALGRSAIVTARQLGMGRLANRAVPGERSTRPTRASACAKPVLPAGLSEREAEVLRLVAGGLSNRQIGDHLYISQNTVANHVRAILQKTSSANRAEAASFAVRRGLVDA
jgi:DNA-binding NarL/FixJ family response regulator